VRSTEIFLEPSAVHDSVAAFEMGLEENDINIAPSMIYAYAAMKEGVPFANGAPNLTVDLPFMQELSKANSRRSAARTSRPGRPL
jgi:myo-inositol-1-phosphate synthase